MTQVNKGGRPSKFTPETRQKLINAIKAGNYYETACKYANITYATYRQWITRGEKASYVEDPSELSDLDLDFLAFYEAIAEAEAAAEMTAVLHWRAQMQSDWKASRDFLARRHPNRWGSKVEVTVNQIDQQILDLLDETVDGAEEVEGTDDMPEIVDAEVVEEEMLALGPGPAKEEDVA